MNDNGWAGLLLRLRGEHGPASRPRPAIIAHRGDSSHAPENTLEAAALGHRAGADGWELDVQLTRDGIPVVIHDPTLTRTTDVAHKFAGDPRQAAGFRVADFDLDEIRLLDAGTWFVHPAGSRRSAAGFGTLGALDPRLIDRCLAQTIRIPTLAEALEVTSTLEWLVNVELKVNEETGRVVPALMESALADIRASARRPGS